MSAMWLLVPALGERQHRLAQLLHLRFVRADEHEDDLRVDALDDRALREQALAVEGLAEREHRALGDDRLVEIEERRFCHALEDTTSLLTARLSNRHAVDSSSPGCSGARTWCPLPFFPPHFPGLCRRALVRRIRREREWPSSRSGRPRVAPARRCSRLPARSSSPGVRVPASSTSAATSRRSSGSVPSRAPASPTGSMPGPGAPTDALDRLAVEAAPGVALIPRGLEAAALAPRPAAEAGAALAVALRDGPVPTLVDAGTADDPAARALLEVSDATIVVVRGCYLTLRRSVQHPAVARAAGIVVVEEPGRAIGAKEIADVLGRPVLARVPARDSIARAVDAGVLAHRLPGRPRPPGRGGAAGGRPALGPARCRGVSRSGAATRDADGALRRTVHQRLMGSEAVGAARGRAVLRAAPTARRPAARSRPAPRLGTPRSASSVSWPTRSRGSGRWSRCSPTRRSPRSWSTAPGAASSSARAGSSRSPLALDDAGDPAASSSGSSLRSGLRLDRASPMVDARLADGSRLHAVIPPLAIDGAVRDHPPLRHARDRSSTSSRPVPRRAAFLALGRRRRMERAGLRRHELGQDHAAQRAVRGDRSRRAGRSRSRRPRSCGWCSRTWCGSRRVPPTPRVRAGVGAGPRAHRAAHAPRPHRGRRGAGRRGARPPPGAEHRPRGCAVHGAREQPGRRAPAARRRSRCSAGSRCPFEAICRPGRGRGRRGGAGRAQPERDARDRARSAKCGRGDGGMDVTPLFRAAGDGTAEELRPVGAPARASRRRDAPDADPGWFG